MVAGARVREWTDGSPWDAHLGQMAFFRERWDLVWGRLVERPEVVPPLAVVGCAGADRRPR
jgi:hypothetical protein